MESTPEELARRAQAGSSSAFAALVERYGPPLLRYLRLRTRGEQDAEDLRQETFVRAMENLHRYDPSRPFATWLFTIATRLAVSSLRARRQAGGLGDQEPAAAEPGPMEAAASREAQASLWVLARRALSADQYAALWLRYAEDRSIRQIARAMGKTQMNVKVLLHRARRRLIAAEQAASSETAAGRARPGAGWPPEGLD